MRSKSFFSTGIFFCLIFGVSASAAALVNINTADSTELQTLNGIGPSKAQAIIDYRTQYGAFLKIEDIQNVSGIGTATYNNIKDYITVGSGASQQEAPPSSSASTTTESTSAQTASGGSGGPPAISAEIESSSWVMAGGGSYFVGHAYGTERKPLSNVRYIWNFGDGTTAEGQKVFHTYAYPGEYVIILTVAQDFSTAMMKLVIEAVEAKVSLFVGGDGSVTVANTSSQEIDVGHWSISCGGVRFVLPEGTAVLSGGGVRFSPAVMKTSCDTSAQLLYPNGALAAGAGWAASAPARGEQLSVAQVSAMRSQPAAATYAAPAQEREETSVAQVAAAAQAPTQPNTGWLYAAGLLAVVTFGAAAAWYARAAIPQKETAGPAEEFEME